MDKFKIQKHYERGVWSWDETFNALLEIGVKASEIYELIGESRDLRDVLPEDFNRDELYGLRSHEKNLEFERRALDWLTKNGWELPNPNFYSNGRIFPRILFGAISPEGKQTEIYY